MLTDRETDKSKQMHLPPPLLAVINFSKLRNHSSAKHPKICKKFQQLFKTCTISERFTALITYNKCSILMIVIDKAASIAEEISLVDEHDRSLSTKHEVHVGGLA